MSSNFVAPLANAQILVAGATGGVGQLVVARLLAHQAQVRVLTRRASLARQLFADRVEIVLGDTLKPATLGPALADITHVICCTGTTAFPSRRWQFPDWRAQPNLPLWQAWWRIYGNPRQYRTVAENSPHKVDADGVVHLLQAAPVDLQRFVYVSSCGVLRRHQFPFNVLNAFGVLDAKLQGEQAIANSGLPYTILRPGRLIDGPYTSYDLNTLLQAKTGGRRGVVVAPGDGLSGDTSRMDVAMACVQCLLDPDMAGVAFAIANQGPRPASIDWAALFRQL